MTKGYDLAYRIGVEQGFDDAELIGGVAYGSCLAHGVPEQAAGQIHVGYDQRLLGWPDQRA